MAMSCQFTYASVNSMCVHFVATTKAPYVAFFHTDIADVVATAVTVFSLFCSFTLSLSLSLSRLSLLILLMWRYSHLVVGMLR